MDPELFHTEISDRTIWLHTAHDIVRFSFIVQPSASYLDLQLCKNSPISGYFRSLSDRCIRKSLRSYVNTEERCRKFFNPSRELLYTLHLDLPKDREHFLTHAPILPTSRVSNSRHVAEIILQWGFRGEMLSNLIRDAFDSNVPKTKILKLVTRRNFSEMPLLRLLPIESATECLNFFYPEIPSSPLFKDFIRHFRIPEWAETYQDAEKLEYLLYCARIYGNLDLEYNEFYLMNRCIFESGFEHIGAILKYVNAAELVEEDYNYYLCEVKVRRQRMTDSLVEALVSRMGEDRFHRMLQIILFYMESPRVDDKGTSALGLMWNSIPDPYVTSGELEQGFGEGLLEGEVNLVHDFYKRAVGESCEFLKPRSLKHLCRTVLRSVIYDNKLWIPVGIKLLPLPESLQLYLNLDQSLSFPFNIVFKRKLHTFLPTIPLCKRARTDF